MLLCEGMRIVGRQAEVVVEHAVVGTSVHTSGRQHRDRQCIGIVGVSIQVSVGIADNRVTHGTISLGLVRVVANVVLLRGGGVLEGTEG